MKEIQCSPNRIAGSLSGRVTFGRANLLRRANDILVSRDARRPAFGYLATITENATFEDRGKPWCRVDSIEPFCEGDIITISADGKISFVYEIRSPHNAIMATELCNHRCIMCPQPPVKKERPRIPENLRLITLMARETSELGITGGEPTMIGDDLFVLINHIRKTLPKTAVTLLTNGVRFADWDYASKLARCAHPDLQVDVPLFSDIASEHNKIVGAKTFYKTVRGLYNLALFRQRIGIRIVVHRQTWRRLPQFADFIYHNFPFVAQVAFMQMETTGLARENFEALWIDPYDYNKELTEAVLMLDRRGIRTFIYNAQLCVLPVEIRPFAVQSISDWKDIYLPECDGCVLRGQCAGFFASARAAHSTHIHRIVHSSQELCRSAR